MPSLLVPSVPLYRNPQLRPGLAALVAFLMERDYTSHAIGKVFDHAAVNGTPTGSPYLDAEDEAGAEAAFVDALEPVPFDSPAWDGEVMCLDAGMLAEGNHPWPIPTRPEDDDDRTIPPDAELVPPEVLELAAAGLAPIAGGAPEPFIPSAADWEDYRRWADETDAREELRAPEARHNPMWGYE